MTHLLYIVNTILLLFVLVSLSLYSAVCMCECVYVYYVLWGEQISYNLSSFSCPVNLHLCVQMNTVTLELELNGQNHPVCLECHLFS